MRRVQNLSVNMLDQYIGHKVYCRGRDDEKKGFTADFIRLYMWR